VFQIADLCEESTVDGIKNALRNLPKDLPATYQRALEKMHRKIGSDAQMAKKAFKWIICAKRPLFMDELKEALAVEPGDKGLNYEKMPSDNTRILRACANLVIFDRDDRIVSLAHHTVKDFLLGPPTAPFQSSFTFHLSTAIEEIQDICLTYLHFNSFETQLTPTVDIPAPDVNTLVPGIMREVLSSGRFSSELFSGWKRIQGFRTSVCRPIFSLGLYGSNVYKKKLGFEVQYRLLNYLVEHWLQHSTNITRKSSGDIWLSFRALVLDKKLPFEFRPWGEISPKRDLPHLPMFFWAVEHGHVPLLEVILELGSSEMKRYYSSAVNTWLETPLHRASAGGHDSTVQFLIEKFGADKDAKTNDGSTALHLAAAGGHDSTVRVLIEELHADKEARTNDGSTALHLAATKDHKSTVQLLIQNFGANKKAKNDSGETVLCLLVNCMYVPDFLECSNLNDALLTFTWMINPIAREFSLSSRCRALSTC